MVRFVSFPMKLDPHIAYNHSQIPSATVWRLLYVFLDAVRCEGVSQETLATWLLRLSPSTRWLGGVFRKTPGTCPRPSGHFGRSLVTLFLELPATPHGSQTIHRVAHGSHRFIVCAVSRPSTRFAKQFLVWHTVRIDSSCDQFV